MFLAAADSAMREYVLRMLGGARSMSGFACVALISALSVGESFDMSAALCFLNFGARCSCNLRLLEFGPVLRCERLVKGDMGWI